MVEVKIQACNGCGQSFFAPNEEGICPICLKPIFAPYHIRIDTFAVNIRSGPGTNYPIVAVLQDDKNLYTVIAEADGKGATKWGCLESKGWVCLDLTKRI